MLVFTEKVGKGVYWIIRTQCIYNFVPIDIYIFYINIYFYLWTILIQNINYNATFDLIFCSLTVPYNNDLDICIYVLLVLFIHLYLMICNYQVLLSTLLNRDLLQILVSK